MYYEINVSLNGNHFFATAERSLTSKSKMEDMFEIFSKKFSVHEGYKITVTKYETIGKQIYNR